MNSASHIAAQAHSFDLEAGNAGTTLREFARQARLDVVMDHQDIQGVQTNEVSGLLEPRVALERMLEGTELSFNEDVETGAFAVVRFEIIPTDFSGGNPIDPANANPNQLGNMNNNKETFVLGKFFNVVLGIALTGVPSVSAQEEDADTIYDLSPFVVEEDENMGYYASQTLSGGRLRQDLINIGSSIQVITTEFLEDIGATGVEELLQYTTSTEVGGILGNFTGATGDGTPDYFTDEARRNPSATTRVRGLAAPDRTRNFFKTNIPFDSYNTGRIEINRGANSFLFGLGSPAGLVNTYMARAMFRDSNELSVRIGSGGNNPSYRASFKLNREVFKDTLAVFVAGLIDRTEYRQEPTFKDDDRLYGSFTYRPFKTANTVITGHIEDGRIRGNAPDVMFPFHNLDTFLDHPTVGRLSINVYENLQQFNNPLGPSQSQWDKLSPEEQARHPVRPPGSTLRTSTYGSGWGVVFDGAGGMDPSFAYVAQISGSDYLVGDPFWDPNGKGRGNPQMIYHGDTSHVKGTGWIRQGFVDLDTFDFSKTNLGWDNDTYGDDFTNFNGALQQLFLSGKAGFEIAYDYQDQRHTSETQFNANVSKIHFDINETLLLPTDINYMESGVVAPKPNPNYGRPFVIATRDGGPQVTDSQQKAGRFTGFFEFDLAELVDSDVLGKLLGRHLISGLFDKSTYDERFVGSGWNSFGDPDPGIHGGSEAARRVGTANSSTPRMVYIGPPQLNAFTDPNFTIHDFILEPAKYNLKLPEDFSIPIVAWNLGPEADYTNSSSNAVINGNERFVEGILMPRLIPNDYHLLQTKVESIAINVQSFFLDDHLVVNTGYREDVVENWLNLEPDLVGIREIPDLSPAGFRLKDGKFTKVDSNIFAYGAVLHWPQGLIKLPGWINELSFHYNKSDNFVPEADRVNALLEPLPAPAGISEDYGVTFTLLDNRLNVRLNKYDATLENATSQANPNRVYGNIFQQLGRHNRELVRIDADSDGVIDQEVIDQLDPGETVESTWPNFARSIEARDALSEFLTPELREAYNYRMAEDGNSIFQAGGNIQDTQDIRGRGYEIEITYNPTPSWRIAVNIANQETILTNIAPRFDELVQEFWLPHVLKYSDMNLNDPAEAPSGTSLLDWANGQLVEYHTAKGQTGRPQAEQRKWRANAVSRYEFREGFLEGFSFGGAVRWQDRYAYGFPIFTSEEGVVLPDVNSPYFSPSETMFDLIFGYRRKIFGNVDWSAQLNMRNVHNWSSDDVSVILVQPDGSPARARFDPPLEILLTNTFRF